MAWYSGFSKAFSSLFGASRPTSLTKPNGGDGVQAYGGYLAPDERRAELIAPQKWLTFANAHHTAIIATGLRYRCNLLASAKWHAEANPRGGRDAEKAVDIVTEGLLSAQLQRPWPLVVRKASMFQVNGFSLFEWTIKRRDDGMVVFSDLGHRPPHTIDRWDKPSEQAGWEAVSQLTRAGNRYTIPRNRLWYCWDDTLTDMPDGVGLMRHVIELVRRLGVLEGLEGLAYESDVRGMPIGRAPIAELKKLAGEQADPAKVMSFIADRTANLRSQLENIIKSPDKLQWLMLDSETYRSADQNNVSSIQKWAFDLLRGDARGLVELDKVIGRLQLEIARVFGIEFVMMGAGSSGSRAMHADKTSMLAASLNAALSEMAASATRDLARPLVALNGLDPDLCTPTLIAESIDSQDVTAAAQVLLYLSQAGLQPNDEAVNVIRSWAGLPDAPEPDPAMMGMLGAGSPGSGAGGPDDGSGGPPNPDDGEVDVPVDDMSDDVPVDDLEKYAPDQARGSDGKWSSGGGGSGSSPRPWTRAFDSRDHQRQIEEHKQTEEYHRDKAAKLTGQITAARGRLGSATPARRAQIEDKIDRLAAQRDTHRQAAAAARTQRAVVRQDLETQRAAHAAGLREEAAVRREAQSQRAQREAIGVIGAGGIRGADGQPDVAPVAAATPTVQHLTEREAQQHAAGLHERLTQESNTRMATDAAARERDALHERLGVGKPVPGASRQVVHYAEPGAAGRSEAALHESQRASDDRAVARNAAARSVVHPGLHAVSLPHAEIVRQNRLSRVGASLRRLVGKGLTAEEMAELEEDALEDLEEYEVFKFDADQPRANDGKWTSGGGGGGPQHDTEHAERKSTIASASMEDGKFTPEVQKVIREQVSSELKQFGIHPNQATEAGGKQHVVTVLSDAELAKSGAAATLNQSTGEMKLCKSFAEAYQRFYAMKPSDIVSQLDGVRHATLYAPDNPAKAAAMAAFAHRTVTHEQIHASGPQLGYFKFGAAIEEVSTEMAARHVHAAALGVDSRDVRGAYNQIIYRNVIGIQKATGVDARTAYGALEHASLSWKRQPDSGREHTPEEGLKFMAEHSLKHLGMHSDSKAAELSDHMVQAWKDEKKAGRM